MNIKERPELALWQKTEMFLRCCNEKLRLALEEPDLDSSCKQEIEELIKENNREIKGYVKAVYCYATS